LPRAARECPNCGAPIQARNEVEAIDGDLVELGARRAASGTCPLRTRPHFTANSAAMRR
jgi:hypothetical protein